MLLEAGLITSARLGRENAARHLLSESGGFNVKGSSLLDSPFLVAVAGNQVVLAGLMLDAGASLSATRNRDG
jgi:hypothetical protein